MRLPYLLDNQMSSQCGYGHQFYPATPTTVPEENHSSKSMTLADQFFCSLCTKRNNSTKKMSIVL